MDAPYTGGAAPGGRIYVVDGDFTIAAPCGAPEIYNPLPGDSTPLSFPIIILDRTLPNPDYVSVDAGTGFNLQTFNQSQQTICIEQEFMVAEAYYVPMALNTPYAPAWSVGWGVAGSLANIGDCFLVEEGPLVSVGAGLVRFKRKFVNLPDNRNEMDSYNASFPALNYGVGGAVHRFGFSRIVNSRIFSEFFVFDELNLLGFIPIFPAGHRLTAAALAANGQFLTFEQFQGFKSEANAVTDNNLLDPDQPLDDGPPATVPSASTYQGWLHDTPSEIVVESSSFTRWMGNIFVRRTRFARAL